MSKKKIFRWDWKMTIISILVILLISLFFIFVSEYGQLSNEYDGFYRDCENELRIYEDNIYDLNNNWQGAYNDLLNCYKNGLKTCTTAVPTLD